MKNKINSSALLLLLCAVFSSCSSIYMPNAPSAPMFEKAGEVYASANISPKANISANIGVAVTDHFALIANGSYINSENNNKDFAQNLIEAGMGYYTVFGSKKNRVFEIYGGYGIGNTDQALKRSSTAGQAIIETQNMNFDKIFLQANYSAGKDGALKFFGKRRPLYYGTIIRMSSINMKDFRLDNIDAAKENNVLIEPVFYTRMGIGKGWQLQYLNGMVFGMKNNVYLKGGYPVFTLGIIRHFGR